MIEMKHYRKNKLIHDSRYIDDFPLFMQALRGRERKFGDKDRITITITS